MSVLASFTVALIVQAEQSAEIFRAVPADYSDGFRCSHAWELILGRWPETLDETRARGVCRPSLLYSATSPVLCSSLSYLCSIYDRIISSQVPPCIFSTHGGESHGSDKAPITMILRVAAPGTRKSSCNGTVLPYPK